MMTPPAAPVSMGPPVCYAGGTVKGAQSGDTLKFPISFCVYLNTPPTTYSLTPVVSTGSIGTPTVTNLANVGAVLNVPVTANGDVTYIAQVSVGA